MSENKVKGRVEVAGIIGPVWLMGWFFTLGFLKLAFWQGVLAILLWPYYLGIHFSALP